MRKRILSILLAVCMLMGTVPMSAFAEEIAECNHIHDGKGTEADVVDENDIQIIDNQVTSWKASIEVLYSIYIDKTFVGILVRTDSMPDATVEYGVKIGETEYKATSEYNHGVYVVDIEALAPSSTYEVYPYYKMNGEPAVLSDAITLTTAAERILLSGYSNYSNYYYEGDRIAVGYGSNAAYNGGAVDFIGNNGTRWLQSTYGNAGWAYKFGDGSWVETKGPKVNVYKSENIQAWVVPETSADGNFGILTYYIRNISSDTIENYKFGAAADIKIGSVDSAPITRTDYGISMTDGTNTFALICQEGYSGINTPVTTIWFGGYSSAKSNVYNSVNSESLSGVDSGASYSWQNITLAPGEIKEFKICMGIGDTDELESLLKPDSSINYINETLTGLTPNATYRITVGTDNFTVTAGSDGTVSIIGTDKNDREYNLIGKNIKISEIIEGTSQVGEAQEIIVAARPDATVPNYKVPGDTIPELPDVLDITTTENSVTICAQAGQEYSIDNGSTWELANNDGKVVFSGLSDGTEYTVLTRVAATESSFASEMVEFLIKTSKMLTITDVNVSGNVHVYDGTAKSLTISSDGATASYATSLEGPYSSTLPEYVNAGNYSLYYKLEKQGYHDYYNVAELEIKRKEIGIDWSNTSFIYDGTGKLPTATAKGLVENDSCNITVSGIQSVVGTYTATATEVSNKNYKLPGNAIISFKIDKATPDIGTVSVNGTVKDTTDPKAVNLTHTGNTEGTFVITDSAMLANQTVYNWNFTPNDETNYETATGTVTIDVVDTVAPTATIKVAEKEWKTVLNEITFGLFFKNTQTVTIEVADNTNGSGIKTVEYYVADAAVTDFVSVQWTEYNGSFDINPDRKYVIYAKVTDNAGNSITVNSDGIIVDATKPVVNLTNDGIYYGDLEINVTDALAGVKELKVDDTVVVMTDGKYTITADNAQHRILVTDNADNKISYTIKVYKNYTVTYKADNAVVTTKTVGHGQTPDVTVAIPAKSGYDKTAPYWAINGVKVTADTIITEDAVVLTAVYTKNPPEKDSDKKTEEKPTLVETVIAPTVTPAAEPEVQPAKKPVITVVTKESEAEVIGEVVVKDKEGLLGFGGMLEHTADQLTDILVSDVEKQLLDDGTDIYIYLENTEITDTVVEEEKELITAVVENIENAQIGAYIDINLYKQIGDKDAEKITNTDKPLTITLPIPQELISTDENVQRTYFMVRVHDGVAEIIDSIHDEPEQTLTFSTDRFSTYAVGYSDVVNEVVTEAEPAPEAQQEAFPWWIVVVGVAATTAIVAFGIYNRKKED